MMRADETKQYVVPALVVYRSLGSDDLGREISGDPARAKRTGGDGGTEVESIYPK